MKALVLSLEPQDGWFACRGSKPVSEKQSLKRKMQWGTLAIRDEAKSRMFLCAVLFADSARVGDYYFNTLRNSVAAAYQLITVCPSKSHTSRNINQAASLSPRGGGQQVLM